MAEPYVWRRRRLNGGLWGVIYVMADNIHLDRVRTDENFNFKTLYDSQEHEVDGLFGDSPFDQIITECDYYDPREFSEFSENLGI